MSKVSFYELSSTKQLLAIQKNINEELRSKGHTASVKLFQNQDGQIGYSVTQIPAAGGKRILDFIQRTVCEAVGYKRGRPPSQPTRQVKCRLPEPIYKKLEREAKRRKISPSNLLSELAREHVQ